MRDQASDSLASAKEVMTEALKSVAPPLHEPLFEGAGDYWPEIIGTRANIDWTDEDLTIAAKLANALLMHKNEQALLRSEGCVIEPKKGSPRQNPRIQVVKTLASEINMWRKDLQMHGRGKNGEARDVAKRRGQRKAIQDQGKSRSSLLAQPE